ncbi:MAG: hypothetical protein AAFP82_11220, partial [Bacteroidota bacterium]
MKLLSITSVFPYPLKTGGHKAQFFILDLLRKDISVDLVCSRPETEETRAELSSKWKNVNLIFFDDIENPKIKRHINFTTIIRRLALPFKRQRKISHLSPYLPKFRNSFEQSLQDYLLTNKYDIIQCEFVPCLTLWEILPKQSKRIFIHHELSFVCVDRTLNTLNPWSRFLLRYQSYKKKKAEIKMLQSFDGVIVFSHIDK